MLTRVLVCLDLVLNFLLALFLSTPLTSPPRIHHDLSLCSVRFFHTSMPPEELARIEYVLEYELSFRMSAHRPPPVPPVPPKPKAQKPPLPPKHNEFVSKDMIPLLPMPLMPARPPPPPLIPRYTRDYMVLNTPIHPDKAKVSAFASWS